LKVFIYILNDLTEYLNGVVKLKKKKLKDIYTNYKLRVFEIYGVIVKAATI
jgi:hypothetical protein